MPEKETFTVRVDARRAVVSRDDGSSAMLRPDEAAALNLLARYIEPERFSHTIESAIAAATTAEASHVLPMPVPSNGELLDLAQRQWPPRPAGVDAQGLSLGQLARRPSRALTDVLESRFSERRYAPLTLADLAGVVVPAARVRTWTTDDAGIQVGSAANPSAGGRHPLALVILASEVYGLERGGWVFLPASCRLVPAAFPEPSVAKALDRVAVAARAEDRLPAAVLVLGSPARTLVRYPAGSTLFWRDVGVQLGYLHLCAADSGLASTITGTSGLLADVLDACVDVGALALGRRAE